MVNILKKYLDNPTRPSYYKTYWELYDELQALRADHAQALKERGKLGILSEITWHRSPPPPRTQTERFCALEPPKR